VPEPTGNFKWKAFSLTVQLVSIQVLSSRVALAAALVRALKLLVQALPAASALLRARAQVALVAVLAVIVAVFNLAGPPPAARGVVLGGRAGDVGLLLHAGHAVGEVDGFRGRTEIRVKTRRHGQDLRRHGMRLRAVASCLRDRPVRRRNGGVRCASFAVHLRCWYGGGGGLR
jgi:hypothetical protein